MVFNTSLGRENKRMENKQRKFIMRGTYWPAVFNQFIVQSIVMQLSNLYIVPMYNDLQVPRTLLSLQSICITVALS